MAEPAPLLRVCRLLNEAGARYLVCGAYACILHGLVRTTEDVDILVEATEENCQRVINGLARMDDGEAKVLPNSPVQAGSDQSRNFLRIPFCALEIGLPSRGAVRS